MSVEDILEWVEKREICGKLTVTRSSLVRNFYFDLGLLAGSSCNDPSQRLERLLLRAGAVAPSALDRALAAGEPGEPPGRTILKSGALTEAALRQILAEQGREALCDAMAWTRGAFVVERTAECPGEVDVPIRLGLRPCIVEARKRARRWRRIREHIPSEDAVLRITRREQIVADGDDERARRELTEIAAALDRGETAGQIARHHSHQRFAALDRLAMLVERGAAAVVASERGPGAMPGDSGDRSVADLLADAHRHAGAGDPGGAYELTARAVALASDDAEAQRVHGEIERAFFGRLCRELLSTFRVPRLLIERDELDQLDMTESERYLARRVDGRWDLLSLMRASSLREVEALITFKRLADRGIISL